MRLAELNASNIITVRIPVELQRGVSTTNWLPTSHLATSFQPPTRPQPLSLTPTYWWDGCETCHAPAALDGSYNYSVCEGYYPTVLEYNLLTDKIMNRSQHDHWSRSQKILRLVSYKHLYVRFIPNLYEYTAWCSLENSIDIHTVTFYLVYQNSVVGKVNYSMK